MSTKIRFSGSISSKYFEDNLSEALSKIKDSEPLILDFLEVNYIFIDALTSLLVFLTKRSKQGYITKLEYYKTVNADVRRFIHVSRFFYILKELTNLQMKDVVVDLPNNFSHDVFCQDYNNWVKPYRINDGCLKLLNVDDKVGYLIEKGFYPLTSLPFITTKDKNITLAKEPRKWEKNNSIIPNIQRNLPQDSIKIGDNIAKHVIYESISNSIRHPNSDKFVISNFLDRKDNSFYIVMWDNGLSIIDTLKNALKANKNIKCEDTNELRFCCCIKNNDFKHRPKKEDFKYIFSDEIPSLSDKTHYRSKDWFFLLSSIFPGITRDPKRNDFRDGKINEDRNPEIPGRGLTYLVNTIVTELGGQVTLRSGSSVIRITPVNSRYISLKNIFLKNFNDKYYVYDLNKEKKQIKHPSKEFLSTVFYVSEKSIPNSCSLFFGNMIVLKIPQFEIKKKC